MVSTPSTRLRLELQNLGENLNTWGSNRLNDALSRIDEAIAGVQAITISGTSTTLTSVNYSTDQARKAVLVLTGTLSANSTITVPNVEKLYLVVNNTTQATYSLTVKTAAGTGYALRGGPQQVYCDGTDVYRATPTIGEMALPAATLDLNGQKIANLGTPTQLTDAATKLYVDIASTLRSMGGYRLYSLGTPVDPADAATKAYVDAGDAVTAVALGTNTVNPTLGRYFTRTISSSGAFVFSAPPSAVYEFTLKVTHTSGTITWPASVTWPGGVAPTLTAGKTHIFKFVTDDTGTKWRGMAWADYTT